MKNSREMQRLSVTVEGEEVSVLLQRKRVKNLNLRLCRDGSLALSAPPRAPLSLIEEFLERSAPFIKRARARWQAKGAASAPLCGAAGERFLLLGSEVTVVHQAGKKNACALVGDRLLLTLRDPEDRAARLRVLWRFFRETARSALTAELLRLLPLFPVREEVTPALSFRAMTSKWGVCRPRENRITLNIYLIFLPPPLVEYVICHELAHLWHADHSAAFWEWLTLHLPDAAERRRALREQRVPLFERAS